MEEPQPPPYGADLDQRFTVREAARLLGISVSHVYQYMGGGELKYEMYGRARRISKRELLRFAAQHCSESKII